MWFDFPKILYEAIPGRNVTDGQCFDDFANAYFGQFYTPNSPKPHVYMEQNRKQDCRRLIIDETKIKKCYKNTNFYKTNPLGQNKDNSIEESYKQYCETKFSLPKRWIELPSQINDRITCLEIRNHR